jgi:hypothetical protein
MLEKYSEIHFDQSNDIECSFRSISSYTKGVHICLFADGKCKLLRDLRQINDRYSLLIIE